MVGFGKSHNRFGTYFAYLGGDRPLLKVICQLVRVVIFQNGMIVLVLEFIQMAISMLVSGKSAGIMEKVRSALPMAVNSWVSSRTA